MERGPWLRHSPSLTFAKRSHGRDIVPNRRPTRGAGVECARRGRDKLPDDVLALLDQHLLDLGGTYGDPEADDPIQYDELRFEHDQGDVEIVVYNRAIPAVHDRQRGSSGFTRCAAGREDIAGSRHPA